MSQSVDLLMPIKERMGLQIVHGIKRYEIRTKPLRFPEGTRVWVHASATSTATGVGAILGSFLYGGCVEIPGPRALRRIALEAAASDYTLAQYIDGRWPAWGLRVASYERLREPIHVTIAGHRIRRFPDLRLLTSLQCAATYAGRRPLSRDAMQKRHARYGYNPTAVSPAVGVQAASSRRRVVSRGSSR